ncbi:MAG TPA: hypothetical protein VFB72_16720 [Verrucomicrobiae bacterium]|nr:hypothetical protein [Verrucomicrobiae bacterium]
MLKKTYIAKGKWQWAEKFLICLKLIMRAGVSMMNLDRSIGQSQARGGLQAMMDAESLYLCDKPVCSHVRAAAKKVNKYED